MSENGNSSRKPHTFGRRTAQAAQSKAETTPSASTSIEKSPVKAPSRARKPSGATNPSPTKKKPAVAPVAAKKPPTASEPQPRFTDILPKAAAKTVIDELLQQHRDEIDAATPNENGTLDDPVLLAVELAKAELASRELARRSLLAFTKRTVPGYDAGWVHEDICRRLEKFAQDCKNKLSPRLILAMPPRLGKLVCDSTSVLTPSGWRKHGDLVVGDEVFSPDGSPVKIVAVSEKAPARVKVTTTEGEEIWCHPAHEWTVYDRSRGAWRTVETAEFFSQKLHSGPENARGGRYRFQLPVSEPLVFTQHDVDLPLDPYVLGAWLGDGTSSGPRVTYDIKDVAVIREIERRGYPATSTQVHNTTGVPTTHFGGSKAGAKDGKMIAGLRAANVLNNKHIPEQYLRASMSQRMDLLGGLIDTDGTVCKRTNRVVFSTVRPALRDGVVDLLTGLGLRPYVHTVPARMSSSGIQGQQDVYMIGFQPTFALRTVLERKQPTRFAKQRRAAIKSVEFVEGSDRVGRCIQVDRADGLYVIGNNLTVTHNSQLASINFPAWVLGNWPDSQFICCSYAQALSENFSKKIKWMMDTPDYETVFPGLKRDKNNDSLAEWSVTFREKRTGGAYIAAGRGTGISGKGAEFLVVDDPIADAEEADSTTVKEGMWDWFTSTAYTRLAPGGGVLVIQTLWADDDLAGRLQQLMKDDPEADQYEVVLYPAIAEEYEYQHCSSHEMIRLPHPIDAAPDCIPAYHKMSDYMLRRSPGDALHPARYDAAKYNKIKRTLPARWWSALYQQNPVPDDGAYYKKEWFKFGPLPPLPDRRHWTVNIAWDFAISEKVQNDYTVGSVILHDDLDIMHVVDMIRFRSGDADTIVDAMVTLMKKWHVAGTVMRVGVEDGQIWRALKGTLIKKLKSERLFHFIGCIEELRPLTDKLARGRALQGRMQTGMVEFISPNGSEHDAPPWFEPARHEMVRFPAGRNDDICDSLAWNAQMLIDKPAPHKPRKRDEKSWRDKLKGLTTNARAKGYMAA